MAPHRPRDDAQAPWAYAASDGASDPDDAHGRRARYPWRALYAAEEHEAAETAIRLDWPRPSLRGVRQGRRLIEPDERDH